MDNIILNTDSYKISHHLQYPPVTTRVSSYLEGRCDDPPHNRILFFGLQAFLLEYLVGPRVTSAAIDEADDLFGKHGFTGIFHRSGWQHIVDRHAGCLPVEITAVPEGTVVPNRNVLLQIVNTDPECHWLTCYLETALLRGLWYPSSVATTSFIAKQIIRGFLEKTADSLDSLPFKLHDFGYRGASSRETGMLGGMAHLVNFLGTDTVGGLVAARKYYGEDCAGLSIPAAEHSTITAWGSAHEVDAYRNMLNQFAKPGSVVAVVSDSYDIYGACDLWCTSLKQQVVDSGATVVIRPDSGDVVNVTLKVTEKLAESFGAETNGKGYRVLKHVRIIQGDSIDLTSMRAILEAYTAQGWSTENLSFGMGAGLLQNVNRDTYGFSTKCSAIERNGEWQAVFKEPKTSHFKRSKRGRLALIRVGDEFRTVRADECDRDADLLRPVFRNGELLVREDFATIRARAESTFD
jgi:nicotinamide phosphoribosyltransferase